MRRVLVALLALCTAASAETVDISQTNKKDWVALIIRAAPQYLTPARQSHLFDTIFCDELINATNEFQRRDVAKNIIDYIVSKSQLVDAVSNIIFRYELGQYDFSRGSFPLMHADLDAQRSRMLFNFAFLGRSRCWTERNALGFMATQARFIPRPAQIPASLAAPEDVAKRWVSGARPYYQIKFDLAPTGVSIGPVFAPRFLISGEMSNVQTSLVDATGNLLEELPSTAAAAPGPTQGAEVGRVPAGDPKPELQSRNPQTSDVSRFINSTLFREERLSQQELSKIYTGRISYFGKIISAENVIKDKINYYNRWSKRNFKIEQNSMTVSEVEKNVDVSFRFTYRVSGAKGERTGRGTAYFTLLPRGDDFVIVSENSRTD